jgi:hypothetical protein
MNKFIRTHTQNTQIYTQALRAAERELETAYVQAVVNCAGIAANCAAPAIQVPPPHLEGSMKQPQTCGKEYIGKHGDDNGGEESGWKENTGGKEMSSPGLKRLLGALTPERLHRKVQYFCACVLSSCVYMCICMHICIPAYMSSLSRIGSECKVLCVCLNMC